MIRLHLFKCLEPRNLREALEMLRDLGGNATVLAGGTDLVPGMKRRLFTPPSVVALKRIRDLEGVGVMRDGSVEINACTTLADIAGHPIVQSRYPSLYEAASQVATPQIRNVGTIGGNLCLDTRCSFYNQSHFWRKGYGFCMKKDGEICLAAPGSQRCWATSSSDLAPVLIALGARVTLSSSDQEKELPLRSFYQDDGIDYLAKGPEEILTKVVVPYQKGIVNTYLKLRRRGSFDFSSLNVAVALVFDADGTCASARIVLGGIGSCPVEVTEAEQILIGQRIDKGLVEEAAQLAQRSVRPLDLADFSASYRRHMAGVYVNRALKRALRRKKLA